MVSPKQPDESFEAVLLAGWEEVYRKSQLSLLILLSLKDSPKLFGQIKDFMKQASGGLQQSDDQSIYRSLRRLATADMIDFISEPNSNGPRLKRFFLTPTGSSVLHQFLQRNIIQFLYDPHIKQLIERQP